MGGKQLLPSAKAGAVAEEANGLISTAVAHHYFLHLWKFFPVVVQLKINLISQSDWRY